MADNYSDMVEIFITKESTAIDTASFGIPLLLATFTNFSERTRTYTSIDEVGDDFSSTSNVYNIASKLFSGAGVRPSSIVVGRRQVPSTVVTPTVANNTVYTLTINGVPYSFTSGGSATATSIVTGLLAAIGSPTGITVSGTTSISIAPTTPGAAWSATGTSNLTFANAASTETWPDALTAVDEENDVWYGMVAETHVPADVMALAGAIEARYKIYGTSTQDVAALSTGTTDIGAMLSANSYNRTYWVYTATADVDYPEAAWMSTQLPETPGSNDWDFKQASGITVSNVSSTARVNVTAKNGNLYTKRAGVNIFQNGNMASGTPIDETIFLDWLRARWQEIVVFRFINSKKIPYTRAGATIIQNDLNGVLDLGVTNGGIAPNPAYTVIAPDPLLVSPTLRAQRVLGDFIVTFRLAGSVRKVIIRATASI